MIAARSNLQLTPFDEDNLAKFEHQRCLLKARVNGVAQPWFRPVLLNQAVSNCDKRNLAPA